MTDRARSEFNTWWERQPFKDKFADVKEQMGNVWVASREECAVELPKDRTAGMSPSARLMVHYHRSVRQSWAESIEAVGLKVKP